jgi:hypothetical protein
MPRSRRIPSSLLLSELELVSTKVQISQPIEMRLEQMVLETMRRARDLGDVTRGEIVGAMILNRTVDDELVAEVRRYRDRATVGDAVGGPETLTLPQRTRGRPKRRV